MAKCENNANMCDYVILFLCTLKTKVIYLRLRRVTFRKSCCCFLHHSAEGSKFEAIRERERERERAKQYSNFTGHTQGHMKCAESGGH